jgi:hypothetical protein
VVGLVLASIGLRKAVVGLVEDGGCLRNVVVGLVLAGIGLRKAVVGLVEDGGCLRNAVVGLVMIEGWSKFSRFMPVKSRP